MDFTHGTARPPGRRYDWVLPFCQLCALMALLTTFTVYFLSYTDPLGSLAYWVEGGSGIAKGVRRPGCHGASIPNEQVLMTSGKDDDERLVIQEGQLHVRSDDPAHRYAGQGPMTQSETGKARLSARQFKLPKLPIPSEILDIPIKIPTDIKDILPDLPVPTIPTDVGDIIDDLPTDPGELISDLPIPTLPPIPTIPTLPVPVPIPTDLPELPKLPVPTGPGTDVPHIPLPTILPPDKPPRNPGDPPLKLPDLTEIPHRVLDLLHHSVAKLSDDPNVPRVFRDILRLILRILNRIGGGDPVPKPKPPAVPTKTKLPLPTLPVPTITTRTLPTFLPPLPTVPKPALTLPHRQGKARDEPRAGGRGEDDDDKPLSDEKRSQLRAAVSDEVWAGADWSNPLVAAATASLAMITFDAVYLVAEAWKGTEDEGEKDKMLSVFFVVDDDETEVVS